MGKLAERVLMLLALNVAMVSVQGFKFLVVNPKFGAGHSQFMGHLADVLADGGHKVVSCKPRLPHRQV